MYLPKSFESTCQKTAIELIHKYSLATLVTTSQDRGLVANHLPLIANDDVGDLRLVGHMARANSQWRSFLEGGDVLAIFQGPHSYISPSWYADPMNVPTWNYVVLHAYGNARTIEDPAELKGLLELSTEKFERSQAKPWSLDLREEFMSDLMNGIVGFEIRVNRLQMKLKLSQNRSAEDRNGVMDALAMRQDDRSRELLAWMKA